MKKLVPWYCTNFEGQSSLDTAAIIIAPNKERALNLLLAHLASVGLVQPGDVIANMEIMPISLTAGEQVIVVRDGDD